jgi:hypothetical protein
MWEMTGISLGQEMATTGTAVLEISLGMPNRLQA